jgi:general secretion pathway protein D
LDIEHLIRIAARHCGIPERRVSLKPKTSSKKNFGMIAVLLGLVITFANVISSNGVVAQVTGNPSVVNRGYIAPNLQQTQPPVNYSLQPLATNPPAAQPYPQPNPANLNYPQPTPNYPQPNPATPNYTTPASNYQTINAGSSAAINRQPIANLPTSLEQARLISTQKLYNARRAIAARDLGKAEQLAVEVQRMNLQYQPNEDRPEVIIALIRQQNAIDEFARANGVTEQFRRRYAIFLLSQANALLNYGDVELAAELNNTAIAQNVLYSEADNKNGISPQAVANRINDIKNYRLSIAAQNQSNINTQNLNQPLSYTAQRDLNRAIPILKSARAAIDNGDLERARSLCAYVQEMQLPDSLFPSNIDSPKKLLGDIAIKSQSVKQHVYPPTNPNSAPNIAPTTPNIAPNRTAPINVTNNNGVTAPASYPQNNHPELSDAAYNEQLDTTRTRHATELPDTSDFVTQAKQAREKAMQQLSNEIIRMISEAKRLMNENRHEDAVGVLNKARQRIDETQLDDATKITYYRNIEDALRTTNKHIDRHRPQIELEARNQEVWTKLKNESEAVRSREEQIKTYVEECARLNAEQEYDQAILIAKKARDFAPNETVTQLLLQHTQMLANVRRSERNRELKSEMFLTAMHGVDGSSIIPESVFMRDISYPTDWDGIKKRRLSTSDLYDRPESEKQIIRKLETPVSFSTDRPIAFREFIDLLRAQTGLNIDVNWTELADAYITSDSPVSLRLVSEIKLKNVLNQVLGQRGLAYVVKNEILNITSARQARGQLIQKTYYIGDLIMPMRDFDGSSPHDMINVIERSMDQYKGNQFYKWNPAIPVALNNTPMGMTPNNGYAVNTNLTPGMINAQVSGGTLNGNGNGTTFTNTSSNDPNIINGAAGGGGADYDTIIKLIKNVTSWGSSDNDGANIEQFDPSKSIVVRQTEEIHSEIVELLSQLRKLSDLQIAVEVRYITISDDYYEKMGIDFQAKIRNDGASNKVILYDDESSSSDSGDSSSGSSSRSGIAKGDNVTVGLQGPSQFQFDLSIPISQNTYGLADPMYGGFNPDSGLRMGFALLSDIEAYFFINATQGDSRSNVLQAPKVMIFNGQQGSVVDSTQSPFVTSVVPVVGDFAIGYQPIIAVLNDGHVMTVRGTVSPNKQYVRLTLEPRFNTITKVSTFRYVGDENATDSTTATGSEASDSGTAVADERRGTTKTTTRQISGVTIQQPIMASFSVQTTVSVPDGGTILMGGIKRLREGRIESGTPILDKIPFINRLFMNTAIGRDTSSILMVVTPRIIIQEEEEEYLTGIRP